MSDMLVSEDFSINSDRGYWDGLNSAHHHFTDERLKTCLIDYFATSDVTSVLELGAGMGDYSAAFANNGIEVKCVDGNPKTEALTDGLCSVADLSEVRNFGEYQFVLSLEVGEHIPQKYEQAFINNVANHAKEGVILSWAVPGQGGDGHFNERPNDYIIAQMKDRGFNYNYISSIMLRYCSQLGWFKNTIMVFNKE